MYKVLHCIECTLLSTCNSLLYHIRHALLYTIEYYKVRWGEVKWSAIENQNTHIATAYDYLLQQGMLRYVVLRLFPLHFTLFFVSFVAMWRQHLNFLTRNMRYIQNDVNLTWFSPGVHTTRHTFTHTHVRGYNKLRAKKKERRS